MHAKAEAARVRRRRKAYHTLGMTREIVDEPGALELRGSSLPTGLRPGLCEKRKVKIRVGQICELKTEGASRPGRIRIPDDRGRDGTWRRGPVQEREDEKGESEHHDDT